MTERSESMSGAGEAGANLNDLLCVGDYVLATKYHDGDPQDYWCVGFYHSTLDYGESQNRYQVVDGDDKQFRGNGFRRIKKISHRRGKWLLDNATQIEASGFSVWHWARKRMRHITPTSATQRRMNKVEMINQIREL